MANEMIKRLKRDLSSLSKRDILVCVVVIAVVILLCFNKNQSAPAANSNDTVTASTSQNSLLEQRLASTLSKIEGAGMVSVFINTKDDTNDVIGAVILSHGANTPHVRVQLQLATQTALGIEASRIKIFEMKD